MSQSRRGEPIRYARLEVPSEFLTQTCVDGQRLVYGGDIRIGDLTGDGRADFLVYRSVDDAHDGGGLKPCFLGAFTMEGRVLWSAGGGGEQPSRPGPVAIHDIDGDGRAEVVCFWRDASVETVPDSMANVVVQIREGGSGRVKRQARPRALTQCAGRGPNWVHQRLLIANLRGLATPRDIVVKLGPRILTLDEDLSVLWAYEIQWNAYGRCSAYIPAVGDIDGDGCDEVNGGYYLLDEDGTPLWENPLGPHMDSVSIAAWDGGRQRAVCSGGGHVLDQAGNVLLRLDADVVPHGQEIRVAKFLKDEPMPQRVIRHRGHAPDVILVDAQGAVRNRFQLNASPNHTGMEVVYWRGADAPALLYNGGMLWDPGDATSLALPDLPAPVGPPRMGWYHCIPADVCGDSREEVILYNPWDAAVYVYTPSPLDESAYTGYRPGPRQYNARFMD